MNNYFRLGFEKSATIGQVLDKGVKAVKGHVARNSKKYLAAGGGAAAVGTGLVAHSSGVSKGKREGFSAGAHRGYNAGIMKGRRQGFSSGRRSDAQNAALRAGA